MVTDSQRPDRHRRPTRREVQAEIAALHELRGRIRPTGRGRGGRVEDNFAGIDAVILVLSRRLSEREIMRSFADEDVAGHAQGARWWLDGGLDTDGDRPSLYWGEQVPRP